LQHVRSLALVAAILGAAFPGHALAWGQTGHRVTGAIATKYLNAHARREIRRLLGPESLAEAATFPDDERPNPDTFWQKEASPLHYADVPKGKSYAESGPPPQGDAVTALAKFTAVLKDPKASKTDKQLALRFVVNIVGDLQMPLHAGYTEDKGGNDVKLTYHGQNTNLHSLWDTGLIDDWHLSYSELAGFLAPKITRAQVREWSGHDPLVWINEDVAVRDSLYPQGDQITNLYAWRHYPLVKQRLSQAGVRIASYLNWIWPAEAPKKAAAKSQPAKR
jgi:hypothetical protein